MRFFRRKKKKTILKICLFWKHNLFEHAIRFSANWSCYTIFYPLFLSKVGDKKNRITFSLKRGCMAVREISSEFISSELTGLNMNDSNLGHCSIVIPVKDGNLILLPMQNLLRTGRSFRNRSFSWGNSTFGMISSSPKSSMSSISSITLQSSM